MKNIIIKHTIILTTILLLSAASCKKNKNENQLPPETHVGAFTFGCKVDGKIYMASGKGGGVIGFDHVYYSLRPSDSSIIIGAGSEDPEKNKFNIFFTIHYLGTVGMHQMKVYPYQGTFSDDSNGTVPAGNNTFITTQANIGNINITYFDGGLSPFIKGTILSGTFEMDAINGDGKVIHITDGRFDIGQ